MESISSTYKRKIVRKTAALLVSILAIGTMLSAPCIPSSRLGLPPFRFEQSVAPDLFHKAEDIRGGHESSMVTSQMSLSSNAERVEHLREFCSNIPHAEKDDALVPLPYTFFAVDRYKVLFCTIHKAASSSTRYLLMNLASDSKQVINTPALVPLRRHNVTIVPINTTAGEIVKKYANYTKVVTVRHPLDRLVSAYKNKLFDQEKAETMSLITHTRRMLQMRHKTNTTHLNSHSIFKDKPTFEEFARYITRFQRTLADSHWMGQFNISLPCTIQYDIINSVESIDADIPFMLSEINAAPTDFQTVNKSKAKELKKKTDELLSSLPPDLYKKLVDVYARDFEAFTYTPHSIQTIKSKASSHS